MVGLSFEPRVSIQEEMKGQSRVSTDSKGEVSTLLVILVLGVSKAPGVYVLCHALSSW